MDLAERRRFDEAIAEYETVRRTTPDSPEVLAFLVHAEAGRGDRARALELRRELVERGKRSYVPSYATAVAALGLGERAAALDSLERAYVAREDALLYLAVEPLFDDLRREPRFEALLERIGLTTKAAGGV
jgi:tetratricopeptide (TPR) repeat protein